MRFDLTALIGVPVVVWVSSLGCGLAVERVLRVRLANALLLPLGLCASLVLIFPGYVAGAGDALAIALLGAVTVTGLIWAQDGLRARLNPGWPGVAAAAVYLIYMLPVLAYGRWTWSGYDFVNDSAFEMLLAEHIQGFGTTLGNIPETSAREFLNSYLNSGYPLGTQSLLGTYGAVLDVPVAVIYQGFTSALAGVGACALALTCERLASARRAALIASVAMSANLTYQYALQGGIKEIGLLAMVCATAALADAALSLRRPYTGAALVAVGAAAALAAYNAVAVPFIGALVLFVGVVLLLARRVRPSRSWLGPLIAGGALAALLAIPSLTSFTTFFHAAEAGQGSTGIGATQFGQLLRPLPLSQVSGVWLAGEYRLPVIPQPAATLTVIATVAIFALAIPGALWALWRGRPGPLLLLGTAVLVLAIVLPRVSPYAQGKVLAIASPAVLLAALVGLAAARGRMAPVGLALTAAIAAGVWASDLLAYGHDRVAPTGRMEAVRATGDHLAGQGPVLWNEFEEYAKYFARAARVTVPFEALTPQQVKLRNPTYFYGHYFDLDEELLQFVEGFPIVVTRRSPAASRPPANYKLVYENGYYEAWRRQPRPQVLEHLPVQSLYSPSGPAPCRALGAMAARAPAGSELVAAVAPELAWFEPLYAKDRSLPWGFDPGQAGAVLPNGPGHASGVLTVRGGDRYTVWVQGDFPRPIEVRLDGRLLGEVTGSNTPGQWLQVKTLQLAAGSHTLSVTRPGGHRYFGPQEWGIGVIGAVALQRQQAGRLTRLPTARWRSLCGRRVDWVELVRP